MSASHPSDAGPLYTEEDHDAICRAVDKLSNAEPPDDPIHSPRPNDHPLAVIAARALKAANNADAEIVRLHKLLAARSPAPSDQPLGADVLASRRETPQSACGVSSVTQPTNQGLGERVGDSGAASCRHGYVQPCGLCEIEKTYGLTASFVTEPRSTGASSVPASMIVNNTSNRVEFPAPSEGAREADGLTVQQWHDDAMRYADRLIEAKRVGSESAPSIALLAFNCELAALRRASELKVSLATRAILLRSLTFLAADAFTPDNPKANQPATEEPRATGDLSQRGAIPGAEHGESPAVGPSGGVADMLALQDAMATWNHPRSSPPEQAREADAKWDDCPDCDGYLSRLGAISDVLLKYSSYTGNPMYEALWKALHQSRPSDTAP